MTQEEKQLLLKDFCSRLSYFENWVQYDGNDYMVTGYGHGRVSLLPSKFSSAVGPCPLVEEVKPYLRPMSSMTEDEKRMMRSYGFRLTTHDTYIGFDNLCKNIEETKEEEEYIDEVSFLGLEDFLNAHHLDYRGLIEKGLALGAPKDMYKTE